MSKKLLNNEKIQLKVELFQDFFPAFPATVVTYQKYLASVWEWARWDTAEGEKHERYSAIHNWRDWKRDSRHRGGVQSELK